MPKDSYALVIARQAVEELDRIYAYIANVFRAPGTAGSAMDEIEHGIRQLRSEPHSAPLMEEPEYAVLGIRKLVVAPYNIFYVANDESRRVEILHVLHGRQDYKRKSWK